jgi:hypothetical protein
MNSKDELNRHKSFEVLCNIVASPSLRKILSDKYLKAVFEKLLPVADSKDIQDIRMLEKLSQLMTLISFYQDMFQDIVKLNLLAFIVKISDIKYTSSIRSNAVLAISMLTYNEKLFDEIIN